MNQHDALVRLLADRRFRDAFIADADRTTANLPPDVRSALLAIERPALLRAADALLDKRVDEFVTALPVSTRLFPPLRVSYRRWLATHPAPSTDDVLTPGLREALRALPALVPQVEPGWVAELVAYEALSRASARDRQRRRLRARWPVDILFAEVARGDLPFDPEESPREIHFP